MYPNNNNYNNQQYPNNNQGYQQNNSNNYNNQRYQGNNNNYNNQGYQGNDNYNNQVSQGNNNQGYQGSNFNQGYQQNGFNQGYQVNNTNQGYQSNNNQYPQNVYRPSADFQYNPNQQQHSNVNNNQYQNNMPISGPSNFNNTQSNIPFLPPSNNQFQNMPNQGGNYQPPSNTYGQNFQINSNYGQNQNINQNKQQGGNTIVGPFLKYSDTNLNNNTYYASVLIVTKKEYEPKLNLRIPNFGERLVEGKILDRYKDNIFIRYNLEIPIGREQTRIEYNIVGNNNRYHFFVQGINSSWKWAFFSCNGFSNDVDFNKQQSAGGANPLWDDLLKNHSNQPFHCMVGGGDQLYCDDVFLGQALKSWLDIPSRKERDNVFFSNYVENEVMDYYFNNYCTWFTYGTFGKANSMIPYSMVIDDHDIFDGFGSYPERMMNSPYFQGIKKCAMRFFLLFQHHTNSQLAERDGYFGVQSYNWLKKFGSKTSVIGIDNRGERTLNQCLSKESYELVFRKLYQEVPNTCKHLMIILGIPIVYPRLSEAEGILDTLSTVQHKLNLHKIFHKTGAMAQMVNQFGQPELLDDLCDHWTASEHLAERKEFILKLQSFAQQRSIRVTFLAGDVHLAAAGYFTSSDPNMQVINDYRHMTQIVSSAIVNLPPPDMVVKTLHMNSQVYRLDPFTNEDMYQIFKRDVDGNSLNNQDKCYNRRNWCEVIQNNNNDQVNFSIMVESSNSNYTVPYTVTVLPLIPRH